MAPSVSALRVGLQVAAVIAILVAILFGAAGRLDWPAGWAFVAVCGLGMGVSFAYLRRVNPEIVAVRQRYGQGTPDWDRRILRLMILGLIGTPLLAALDAGRWGGAALPPAVLATGHLLLGFGFVVTAWAQGVNRHFEPTVRIQSDRDHRVVDVGPYAHVRHPGYVAAAALAIGMALALGSALALLPALSVVALLVLRTVLEERLLQAGLPGYAAYAARVRHRWVPGIW